MRSQRLRSVPENGNAANAMTPARTAAIPFLVFIRIPPLKIRLKGFSFLFYFITAFARCQYFFTLTVSDYLSFIHNIRFHTQKAHTKRNEPNNLFKNETADKKLARLFHTHCTKTGLKFLCFVSIRTCFLPQAPHHPGSRSPDCCHSPSSAHGTGHLPGSCGLPLRCLPGVRW